MQTNRQRIHVPWDRVYQKKEQQTHKQTLVTRKCLWKFTVLFNTET